jgi:hypothetical protein
MEDTAMPIETSVEPTGTGQQGAGAPAGTTEEIPIHIEGGKPVDKVDQIADRASRKGMERQHREDPDIFTK